MSFIESIKSVFRQYAEFYGSAGRSEFWYFFLFQFLVSTLIGAIVIFLSLFGIAGGLAAASGSDFTSAVIGAGFVGILILSFAGLGVLFSLAILVPTLAVGSRRLHQAGLSGWWQLVQLVPVAGSIAYYVLMALPPKFSDNRYQAGGVADPFSARTDQSNAQWQSTTGSDDWY